MTEKEALKLALEAFEEIAWSNSTDWQRDRAKVAITAIKEALAQPEQEPVVWAQFSETKNLIDLLEEPCGGYVPLYTTPPQRKPLTDEEIDEIYFKSSLEVDNRCEDIYDFARTIEAKLKEKNT